MTMRLLILIALLNLPIDVAAAEDRRVFFGTWGTAKQCAREPIKPGGTFLAEPYEIGDEWLRQGQLWCLLSWGPIEKRPDGYFSGAHARCGEDTVRQYFLGMVLSDGELTLRWGFPASSGPLRQCPRS
ncbi:hypothetical protein [Labrenzia sp. VG12]|uniref:hypothetical protein n=1 Tax=Labrenzia sp. VG12 TaxID=2021862 RepID=UPI0012FDC042|nr:hypothetical protein [Labrenzia sp. VG12]